MNEGIHLDLDTWIVPGQIRKANLCRGLGNMPSRMAQFKEVGACSSSAATTPASKPGWWQQSDARQRRHARGEAAIAVLMRAARGGEGREGGEGGA